MLNTSGDIRIAIDGLIPIYKKQNDEKVVNARELHSFLGVKKDFPTWIKYRINKYRFLEGSDFSTLLVKTSYTYGGRPFKEYYLSLDCAKEISMVENNSKGKKIRKFFIEVENRYQTLVPFKIPKTYSEALLLASEQQTHLEQQQLLIAAQTPKVEQYELFLNGTNYKSVGEAAKAIGIGRTKLFSFLRDSNILMSDNTPYQRFMTQNYFIVVEHTIILKSGRIKNVSQPKLTAKGMDFISKLLNKQQ